MVNDQVFLLENEKADWEVEKAKQLLLQTEREAQIMRKKHEAEEVRRKTLELQQQTHKDKIKAEQEKNRYEKEKIAP